MTAAGRLVVGMRDDSMTADGLAERGREVVAQ